MLEMSKSIKGPTFIIGLLAALNEPKKQPIDYRRDGLATLIISHPLFAH